MNSFSMASPPAHGGIYVLKNRKTGVFYVGQGVNLKVRYAEWKGTFSSGLGHKSTRMREAMVHPEDWDFIVLEEHPAMSRKDLLVLEADRIRRFNKCAPALILNTIIPGAPRTGPAATKTKLTYEGMEICYALAVDLLGCSRPTLDKRLQKLRDHGTFEISVEELIRTAMAKLNPERPRGRPLALAV
jgi:hypothetical protein